MIFKSNLRSGPADASDLQKDSLIQFQHRHYFLLAVIFGIICPAIIPGVFWGDWSGGIYFSATLRLTIAHHVTHWLGSSPYDDELSPRDHLLSAILTMGEGYHNFHHQFPMDYRNAFHWYQYDPTKWFIALCAMLGLASHLRVFPENEIRKGMYTMKLKELKQMQDTIRWAPRAASLPVVTWEQFQQESRAGDRILVLISGFIHDVTSFVDLHPGGRRLIVSSSGKDMSSAFFGGVYSHSNAAHNLLSMYRVGVLLGGMETISEPSKAIPPSERLVIARKDADEVERKEQKSY
ncbi:delta-9 fatty acid desaturase [Coprinopsis cinerea okayama7|uniref:Delta-9 fatty acid desaturase n=1 Tax=Coprinopsis cinerea (strain Okayama-7 / 130 / ATCC MYA-4618 / FGSC 9003) TaxID=240176 RepID=D6RQT1_COPC7|nr:delta-9 fatty acid desaturase [Coprinopsis cinerea okayama7\|eukprot:XP_002910139.1 delta-9 fatty acid desaturase [Coprinopsis cinerea okayama7\